MRNRESIKSKVAGAVKFFFMGDDEPMYTTPSSALKLIDAQLDMITGGNVTANATTTFTTFEPAMEKKKGGASGSWDRGGASGGWGSGASGSW